MLDDQQSQNSFSNDLKSNFSVIASPGTGKTTAITNRISNIICNNLDPNSLQNFLAVTYTEKAANEIKFRVTENIVSKIKQNLTSSSSLEKVNKIFFGTIHSLCARLLRDHHFYWGIKNDFEIIENDDELWQNFIETLEINNESNSGFFSLFSIEKILHDVRLNKNITQNATLPTPFPENEALNILNYKPSTRENTISNFQKNILIWSQNARNAPFPQWPQTDNRTFSKFLSENAPNLLGWLQNSHQYLVSNYIKQYQNFRITNNTLTYDDLIDLTLKLLSDKTYRKKNIPHYQIILDEAQDTDPSQFKILLNLANENCYDQILNNSDGNNAVDFSFSMVGDPKQTIYSNRADIKFYTFIHQKLSELNLVKPLNFNITMRCSKKIVSFVNKHFNQLFTHSFSFQNLMKAREDAEIGEVSEIETNDNIEALNTILCSNLIPDVNIKKYSNVAILTPRKSWLIEIVNKLKKYPNVPKLQLCTNESLENKPSLIKWTAAILHYILYPIDKHELVGILREIFGISSDEIISCIINNQKNSCLDIISQLNTIRDQINLLFIPNLIRKIIESFDLICRLNSLEIYSDYEITRQYDTILDISYFIDSHGLGYDILEKKLIEAYRNPLPETKTDPDAIQLLTFHKSKGLEWPIVILPFLYREHKLIYNQQDTTENIDNEIRMLFVACTRAKNKLILLNDYESSHISGKSNMISSGKLLNEFIEK